MFLVRRKYVTVAEYRSRRLKHLEQGTASRGADPEIYYLRRNYGAGSLTMATEAPSAGLRVMESDHVIAHREMKIQRSTSQSACCHVLA
jgi:hypothetical protein